VRRASPAERYRGFLAFWALCAMSALDSRALVIDVDAIGEDLAHRRDIEQALQARIGEPIQLVPRASPPPAAIPPPPGWREAHDAAGSFVRAHGLRLSTQRLSLILQKLGDDDSVVRTPQSWRTPVLPMPVASAGLPRRIATWAQVRFARAMQPLRRLHGSIAGRDLRKGRGFF
jgi:hypothetical protein